MITNYSLGILANSSNLIVSQNIFTINTSESTSGSLTLISGESRAYDMSFQVGLYRGPTVICSNAPCDLIAGTVAVSVITMGNTTNSCNNWTSTSGVTTVGEIDAPNTDMELNFSAGCNQYYRFICVEQSN